MIRRIVVWVALVPLAASAAAGGDGDALVGHFSAGLQLPFADPRIWAAMLVTALALALRGPADLRRRLLPLAACAVLGVLGGPFAPMPVSGLLLGVAVLTGGLCAAWPGQPDGLRLGLGASGAILAAAAALAGHFPEPVSFSLGAGTALGVMLGIAIPSIAAASLTDLLPGKTPRIALRIAASWLAAISAMVLALDLARV